MSPLFSRLAHSYEGNVEFLNPPECEGMNEKRTPPVYQYRHSRTDGNYDCATPVAKGSSITGGLFYSGNRWPELKGKYLFADFEGAVIYGLQLDVDGKKVVDDFQLAVGKRGEWRGEVRVSKHFVLPPL